MSGGAARSGRPRERSRTPPPLSTGRSDPRVKPEDDGWGEAPLYLRLHIVDTSGLFSATPGMDDKRPLICTYIEASRPFGVLYIGMTSNLYRRGREYREGAGSGFTKRYGCSILVWYQTFERVTSAIRREKALKRWNRPWKMQLIEKRNPEWRDLYPFLLGEAPDPRLPLEDDGGVAGFLARLEAAEGEGD